VPIEQTRRRVAARRLAAVARSLLDAAPLCAIATVGPAGEPHVSTAYFAWSDAFELVWASDPEAKHSRNLRGGSAAAIAVYDSCQTWGKPDRGIQLFGDARESDDEAARHLYERRFPDAVGGIGGYRFYGFVPHRVKLFDETALGGGVFVTATVAGAGLTWERTEVVRP
jgi:uncharacterized protein YhbP (UPF0306 family)